MGKREQVTWKADGKLTCLVDVEGSWHEKLTTLVTHFSLPILAYPFQGHWVIVAVITVCWSYEYYWHSLRARPAASRSAPAAPAAPKARRWLTPTESARRIRGPRQNGRCRRRCRCPEGAKRATWMALWLDGSMAPWLAGWLDGSMESCIRCVLFKEWLTWRSWSTAPATPRPNMIVSSHR